MKNRTLVWPAFLFLPDRRYDSAGLCESNVSVRPSVTRRYRIVSKRRKLASWFLHRLVAPRFPLSVGKFHPDILTGSPRAGALQGWGVKIEPFSSFKHQYLNKKAVLSQRWPRDARYISRSWAIAEIWPIEIIRDGGGRNLEFIPVENSAIRSAVSENLTL